MEFIALALWLLLGGLGMLLLPAAITAPGAAIAAIAAFTGVVIAILWIVLDAPEWTGWAQLGLALLGIVGATLATRTLVDDRNVTGSAVEEVGAAALGLVLPFYGALIAVTLLMAVGATDPVV
jgi:hypothetical protein